MQVDIQWLIEIKLVIAEHLWIAQGLILLWSHYLTGYRRSRRKKHISSTANPIAYLYWLKVRRKNARESKSIASHGSSQSLGHELAA